MRRLSLLLLVSWCLAMTPDDVSRHTEWMDTAQDHWRAGGTILKRLTPIVPEVGHNKSKP
jgi:hypothetical protein